MQSVSGLGLGQIACRIIGLLLYHLLYPLHEIFSPLNVFRYITFRSLSDFSDFDFSLCDKASETPCQ